jgi:hypothetical protein
MDNPEAYQEMKQIKTAKKRRTNNLKKEGN